MSARKKSSNKIRAWITSPTMTTDVVENIQTQFERNVTVSRLRSGDIAVYPSWRGNRSIFDLFMIKTGAFSEARIDLRKV